MQDDVMKKLKEIEIEMLEAFVAICNKYDLKWFVVGGTALGAVRHNGFIPWDDDIDVAMPRPDYEKFLEVAQENLPPHLFLQNTYTDKEIPWAFSKIRNSMTTFVERPFEKMNFNHGVYIDVFPLDGFAYSKISYIFFKFKKYIYDYRISFSVYELKDDYNPNFYKKTIQHILKVIYPHHSDAVRKKDQLYKKHKYYKCRRICNFSGAWGLREMMDREIFDDGVKASFENVDVNIATKYHDYLQNMYGNYMEFPPIEKRVTHHHTTVIDPDNSYKKYMEI